MTRKELKTAAVVLASEYDTRAKAVNHNDKEQYWKSRSKCEMLEQFLLNCGYKAVWRGHTIHIYDDAITTIYATAETKFAF